MTKGSLPIIAVGLAAGRGERVRPLTLKGTNYLRSKAAIRFMGRRIIHWQLDWLAQEGVSRALIVAKGMENRYQVKSNVGYQYHGVSVYYSPPILDALDTGSADATLRNAAYFQLRDPLLVFPVDSIFDIDVTALYRFYQAQEADVVVVSVKLPAERILGRYGVIVTDDQGRVLSFREKPSVEQLMALAGEDNWAATRPVPMAMNTGVYLIRPELIHQLNEDPHLQVLRKTRLDFGRDFLPWLVKEQYRVFTFTAKDVGDLGNIPDFLETMNRVLHGQIHVEWPEVTIAEPFVAKARPRVHPTAVVQDSRLGANVQIGPYARVVNSTLGDDVIVEPHGEIVQSHLDEGCHIESYARIDRALLGVLVHVHSSQDQPTTITECSGLGDEVVVEPGLRLQNAIVDPRTHVYADQIVEFP